MPVEFEVWMAWALAVCVVVLGFVWQGRRGSRRAKKRARRAVRGEERARKLLEANGYEILDSQAAHSVDVTVDGEMCEYDIRADFLVKRNGKRYVAEVKTGNIVPNLSHGPTRRQLLEYTLAYQARGTLLVLPEKGQVHFVAFPKLKSVPSGRWLFFILGVLTGLLGMATYVG